MAVGMPCTTRMHASAKNADIVCNDSNTALDIMIETLSFENLPMAATMAHRLWPDEDKDLLLVEFGAMLRSQKDCCLLWRQEQIGYTGFIHAALRYDHVEGTATSPVAYIEAVYVEPGYRKQQVATTLMDGIVAWARQKGCTEMASDTTIDNDISVLFHKALGFEEVARLVCFARKI
jgi:aminoglycoside 6'-N-acetyltransferase I